MKINIGPYARINWHNSLWQWYMRNNVFEENLTWYDNVVKAFINGVDWLVKPINNIPRKIKIKYHDYDTWNLDDTLARIILPGLIQLRDTNHGFATIRNQDLETIGLRLPENIEPETQEAWLWVQNRMIDSFTKILEDKDYDKEISEGLLLFGLYYRALWD